MDCEGRLPRFKSQFCTDGCELEVKLLPVEGLFLLTDEMRITVIFMS